MLELVLAHVTAPGADFDDAMTPGAGNSFTVRSLPGATDVRLLQVWADVQGAGTFRLTSPNLHDNVQGIRFDTVVGDVVPLMPWGSSQRLLPQDTLVPRISGSATAGDIESACLLVHYGGATRSDTNYVSWSEIVNRIENLVNVENTLALGTGGGWTGEEAIDAEFDLLKANTEYALLGYMADAECAAVRYRGADVGNYGVGGPGEPGIRHITKDWFISLSDSIGQPLIPVFNAANKSGILIDGAQDENGTDATVTSIFAELA
jgi:hypothetical protein